jgi:hypothetical protein
MSACPYIPSTQPQQLQTQTLVNPELKTICTKKATHSPTIYKMSGKRAPDRKDNILGWEDVKHTDQESSSVAAEYAPKKKGKAVTASGFTQPGTPTEERRWESDKAWILDGDRKNASIGNAVAGIDRDRAGIATKDWAKRS